MKKSNGFGPALIGALLGALLPALGAEAQTLTSIQVSATPAAAHAGETVQLHVLGTRADGTSVDVTSGAQGTLYSTSEPALQISADGLVAVSQPAFRSVSSSYPAGIVVSNGSVAASILLDVLPVDNDHDGMEDGYELARGFDPTRSADAAEDADGDGLTNLQEFMMGTDPHNRDTDGDGVPDGFEATHGGSPLDPHVQLTLGEQCTASALNRVTQVERGGGFSLSNVPTPLGKFRVRFVCDFADGMILAETPLTAPIPNGITSFPSVTLSTSSRPLALTVTADHTALGSGGATARLTALALLAGGGQADLTAAATGTIYRSSSSSVATVSADGLVTAVASGTVLITAINESVAGTVRLQVQLSGDADGDGIPDDYERANATNPGGNNLATLPGVQVNASSASFGFPATQAVDGDLATSWLTSFGDSTGFGQSPFIEVTFPADVGVAQVRLLGLNRQLPGHEIFTGFVQAFDASGTEIFNSGSVQLPAFSLDLRVPVDRDGVRRVRFTSIGDQCCTPGLAEFQVISRPGGPGFDPNNPADAGADFDGDGLTNLQEFQLGTNPFSADTDGDGVTDGQEIALGTNPLVADTDGDGLTDGQEIAYGTNPLVADTDGDGLPDGVEVRLGLSPLLVDSNGNGIPDGSEDSDGDGLINLEELQSHTDPGNPDTDGDGLPDGSDPDPLRPDRTPPTVTLTAPVDGDTLFQGQTLDLAANASDDGRVTRVDFLVNGAVIGSATTPPYGLRINVPYATSQLTFAARAVDTNQNTGVAPALPLTVAPSPVTTVRGTFVDASGNPIAGATVSLQLQGMKGEFFSFNQPLTELPDLTGLTPSLAKPIAGLAFRNPGGLLSPDTFGVSLASDFAGRFTGFVSPQFPSFFTVTLGAADGARVLINGNPIVEVAPGGAYTETQGGVFLPLGTVPIEVDYFTGQSPAELRLDFSLGGLPSLQSRIGVPPQARRVRLLTKPDLFTTSTGPDGSFTFSAVPFILGDVEADATVSLGGLARMASVSDVPQVPGGVTDVGTIALAPVGCVTGTLTYNNCLSGPVTHPLMLLNLDSQGNPTTPPFLVATVNPDASGHFCAELPLDRPYYFLKEEELTCNNRVAPCHTTLSTSGLTPGQCGDESTCTDLGNVNFQCDFFHGS